MTEGILIVGDSEVNQNLYYATHFLAEGLVYLGVDGHQMLITSDMELGRAKKQATVPDIRTMDQYNFREVAKELNDRHRAWGVVVSRVVRDSGAEGVVVGPEFPALLADNLRGEGVEVRIDPKLMDLARRQKSPEEIAAIEEAQRANERVTAHAIDILRDSEERNGVLHYNGIPLTSERLRSEVEVAFARQDMDPGSPILAGGRDAADPHFRGTGPYRSGEAIVMDIFPRSKQTRYWADMTRTVVKGEPTDTLRRMYQAVLEAQEAAFAHIRAGVNGNEVHEAAAAVFKEAGFDGETGPRYIHSTGHGVGLDIHEAPGLGYLDVELLENDVVTVEPGLYDPEIGGVRIEDMVVVTKDGYRNLTNFPKEFEL